MCKNYIFLLITLITLASCNGYYKITGKAYTNNGAAQVPANDISVKVFCGDWFRGITHTDSTGHYGISGLSTRKKANYYIIFENPDYRSDTVKVAGNKRKTVLIVNKEMVTK
jgi:hypothetical protein